MNGIGWRGFGWLKLYFGVIWEIGFVDLGYLKY
jgi:hypothetical protein